MPVKIIILNLTEQLKLKLLLPPPSILSPSPSPPPSPLFTFSFLNHFFLSIFSILFYCRALEHKWLKIVEKDKGIQGKIGSEGPAVVVMVVGAGRGPLVAATIR